MSSQSPDPSCNAGFGWMNNGKGQNPCEVTGWLISLCVGQSSPASLPTLTAANYNAPDSNSETQCTCSWAFYNAMQACTACQNHTPQGWQTFSSSCNFAGLSSTTSYWPQSIPLSGDTSFPQWAIVNPMSWDSQRFDVNQAQSIASQNLPDATDASASQPSFSHSSTSAPSTSSQSSSSKVPIGAIVGGAVGGAIVLGIIVGICLYFLLKRKYSGTRREPRVRLDLNGGADAVEKLFSDPATMHSSPSSPQLQPVLLHRQSTAHHEFNPYTIYDPSTVSTSHTPGHAPQLSLSLSESGASLMGGVAPMGANSTMNSSQPTPIRAFPGIPTPDGRIPSVEEQLSEKRRLRSEQRKNSNPPLSTNGYFNSVNTSSGNTPGSRRTSPSPVRTSSIAGDVSHAANTSTGRASGESLQQSRNVSTDSLGKLAPKHRRGSSSNDLSVSGGKAPRMVWQNHQQHEGDDNDNASDEEGGDAGAPFLTMRTRQSVDEVIASVPGARKPTQKDRENPPPMYIRTSSNPILTTTSTPARSSTSPPSSRSPQ